MGREDYAVSCVTYNAARAFCTWEGGDLPTEAQWEYVAADAGRPGQTRHPWGGDDFDPVTCARAVFGRGAVSLVNDACNEGGTSYGPLAVTARVGAGGDVSAGLGVVGLLGGVQEFMRDAFASFESNCWASQPLESPACIFPGAQAFSTRGQGWDSPLVQLLVAGRLFVPSPLGDASEAGFRCVRPGQ